MDKIEMNIHGGHMLKKTILLLFIFIFMLNGCGNSDKKPKKHFYLDAVILEISDTGGILVETSKEIDGKIIKSEIRFYLDEEQLEKKNFQVGDEITIDYNGITLETYPEQIDEFYGVELKDKKD